LIASVTFWLSFAVAVLDGDEVGSALPPVAGEDAVLLEAVRRRPGFAVDVVDIASGDDELDILAPIARCIMDDVRRKYGTNEGVRRRV
jgi:hypothetical protein